MRACWSLLAEHRGGAGRPQCRSSASTGVHALLPSFGDQELEDRIVTPADTGLRLAFEFNVARLVTVI
jgi:hypothetical protein